MGKVEVGSGGGPLSCLCAGLRRALDDWKWPLAYTALLFLSLPFAREALERLDQAGLSGVLALALLSCWAGLAVFLLRRAFRRRARTRAVLGTVFFLALYAAAAAFSTSLMAERIHFIEYGILAVLCLRAAVRRLRGLRALLYSLLAVVIVGFLDEVIQGFLPGRFYDLRDILIDTLAGALPVVGLSALSILSLGPRAGEASTRQGLSRPYRVPDLLALALFLGLVGAVHWLDTPAWGPVSLVGSWERENPCGRFERVRIGRNGGVSWEDSDGNRAAGRFRVEGNRLDGPRLRVEILQGKGEGPCVWRGGTSRIYAFRLDAGRLLFCKEADTPFLRVDPSAPLGATGGGDPGFLP